jgi:plastocyanin
VSNNAYSPTPKTVTAGTTVTWTWRTCTGDTYSGQACVTHNVTFDDGVSSPSQDNGSFTRTFAAPGTYNYHCTLHAMSGQVQVTQ